VPDLIRQLIRRPRSSVLAIITIGLALGATVGIGSIVDHAVLRPLPYQDPDRLVVIWNTYPHWRDREMLSRFWDRIELSWPEYKALRGQRSTYDEVALYRADDAVFGGSGRPEIVLTGTATHGLLRVLGVTPGLGRWFAAAEDLPGAPPVAVLSYEFWRTRLGADPAILGRAIVLDEAPVPVIGIMPEGFSFRSSGDGKTPDLWLALGRSVDPADEGNHSFSSVARLRGGVTLDQAQSVTLTVLRGDRRPEARGARLESREEYERGAARPVLLLFAGAVGVLLLLACATVATMQLTRVAERDREIAVRAALGASPGRIARQLLGENLVLGLAGGGLGISIAAATIGALRRLMPSGVPGLEQVRVDLRLLIIAGGLTLVSALIFGTASLVAGARRNPGEALHAVRSTRAGRGLLALIAAQAALAVLLLSGAALLVQTVRALGAVDPGFEVANRLGFGVVLPPERYPGGRSEIWFEELANRVGALPGVTAVDATSVLPLSGASASNSIWLASEGPETGRRKPEAERRIVTPHFLATMGVRLLHGRGFLPTDAGSSEPVMVVSRTAADRLWAGRDPIGDRVEMSQRWWTVVGVVEDVLDRTLAADPAPTVYVPSAQWPQLSRNIVVRSSIPPEQLIRPVREIVRAMDPEIPVRDPLSLREVVSAATQPERSRAVLLVGYALLATLVAITGLYGVTAYLATQQTREIGIRMALGARLAHVLRLVMRRTMLATGGGAAIGILLAFGLTRLLRRFLFGVDPTDPGLLAVAVVTLIVLATMAAAVPAFRSARTPPTEALRAD
jgi:putative ABC transport system permease protein